MRYTPLVSIAVFSFLWKTPRFLTSRASWYCYFALSLFFVYKRSIISSAAFMSWRLDIHTNRYMYCKLTQEMIAVWHRQSIMTLRLWELVRFVYAWCKWDATSGGKLWGGSNTYQGSAGNACHFHSPRHDASKASRTRSVSTAVSSLPRGLCDSWDLVMPFCEISLTPWA